MELKTDNIDEATIVSETKTVDEKPAANLQERMDRVTLKKTPGENSSVTNKPETKSTSNYWDASDDDFEKPKVKPEPEKEKEKEKTETKESAKSPGEKTGKMTDRAKEGSARTAVGMVELTQGMILKPWINHKFNKQFTPEDIDKLANNVMEAEKSDLEKSDLKLRNKFDKLMAKRDKLMGKVPLDTTEKKDLTEAFYNYFDITEKTMPPEWYLAFALINCTGNRIIDIAFD